MSRSLLPTATTTVAVEGGIRMEGMMATETKKQPWTPYDAVIGLSIAAGDKEGTEILTRYQVGYIKALRDMAPLRESHKTLVAALHMALTHVPLDRKTTHRTAREALGAADAIEKGEA